MRTSVLFKHISHLLIRDPLVIFSEKIDLNDEEDSDHFENLQSTNWHNMRFKPPPPNTSIGWRVEFRPMELQTTEFENAAFTVFIVLLSRVILSYGLDFLIPISMLGEILPRCRIDVIPNERNIQFIAHSIRGYRAISNQSSPLLIFSHLFPTLTDLNRARRREHGNSTET